MAKTKVKGYIWKLSHLERPEVYLARLGEISEFDSYSALERVAKKKLGAKRFGNCSLMAGLKLIVEAKNRRDNVESSLTIEEPFLLTKSAWFLAKLAARRTGEKTPVYAIRQEYVALQGEEFWNELDQRIGQEYEEGRVGTLGKNEPEPRRQDFYHVEAKLDGLHED